MIMITNGWNNHWQRNQYGHFHKSLLNLAYIKKSYKAYYKYVYFTFKTSLTIIKLLQVEKTQIVYNKESILNAYDKNCQQAQNESNFWLKRIKISMFIKKKKKKM